MKKLVWFTGIICLLVLNSCDNIFYEEVSYTVNDPVISSLQELRSVEVAITKPQPICNYGKICLYNDYLYIAETGKGIHIINNTNQARPVIAGFIELQGNADIAIRNDKLYADSYVDLLWFDISNPAAPEYKGRLENVLNFMPSPDNGYPINYEMVQNKKDDQIITGWTASKKKRKEKRFGLQEDYDASPSTSNGGSGINGSMSRFSLYQDYLYVVLENYMSIFDISEPNNVQKSVESLYIGNNVETIFSYKTNMFMGTPTGLLIYSVENPVDPLFKSMISHVYGCDPVVVEDDIAYVTVHSGNFCGQNSNELIVIDVKDVNNPYELATYNMTKPKGLGIDNKTLFVCDEGLKIFNAQDPYAITANQLVHYSGMEGYDVIPYDKTLMMVAEDGLYQYDYSDVDNITLLSKLPFERR